ncbi:unnamed protein product [Adineta steineri]|uniref:G-protein coupled receptors family 1 profile domain-containing protein n=1 Tax=Adineta steineri TaxID=433720 RepID=A0A815PS50_9BILA|nr:unnamed protein product [Adineta steineri]CAF1453362.1 unnamed protein product [Adineta steineri]
MSTSHTNSTQTISFSISDGIAIPYIGRFWLLLIPNTLSLICSLFVLFHFLFDSTLRHALHNHVIIVILIVCIIAELTTIPFMMYFYLNGVVWIQSPIFCMIWKFFDSATYTTVPKLVGWSSMERHIIIFHSQWISTKKKRFLIHYLPIGLIVIYGIVLYGVTTPMNDCHRRFNYKSVYCSYYSCIYDSVTYSLYEFMSGGVLSSACIGFGSIFLIVRIALQKRRLQQQMQWRKYRKISIQLMFIALIFFVFYLPPILLAISQKLGVPSNVGADYNRYANLFSSYIILLFPFACINTLPKLKTRIKKTLHYFCRRRIPTIVPLHVIQERLTASQAKREKKTIS